MNQKRILNLRKGINQQRILKIKIKQNKIKIKKGYAEHTQKNKQKGIQE